MSLYKNFCTDLIVENTNDGSFILGIVKRKEPDIGSVVARTTTDADDRHSPEWTDAGITWRFVPELKLITFWERPSQNELLSIKEWLIEHNFDLRGIRVRIYGTGAIKTIKINPNEPDFVRRQRQGIDENKFNYCGVLLDDVSRLKLKNAFSDVIPDNYTIKCHHMTIDPFNKCKENIGSTVSLMVTHFGKNDLACAVRVVGYNGTTNNAFPHITLAVNEIAGGKPKDSNKIKDWIPVTQHIVLTGTIENL